MHWSPQSWFGVNLTNRTGSGGPPREIRIILCCFPVCVFSLKPVNIMLFVCLYIEVSLPRPVIRNTLHWARLSATLHIGQQISATLHIGPGYPQHSTLGLVIRNTPHWATDIRNTPHWARLSTTLHIGPGYPQHSTLGTSLHLHCVSRP